MKVFATCCAALHWHWLEAISAPHSVSVWIVTHRRSASKHCVMHFVFIFSVCDSYNKQGWHALPQSGSRTYSSVHWSLGVRWACAVRCTTFRDSGLHHLSCLGWWLTLRHGGVCVTDACSGAVYGKVLTSWWLYPRAQVYLFFALARCCWCCCELLLKG